MTMRNVLVKFALLAVVVSACGCLRFKGVESFKGATTPVQYDAERLGSTYKGDPYANGGIAYASAGHKLHTNYGAGSDPNSPNPVDPKLDKPAKGSGQQPGEFGGDSAPGTGKSNAPADQGMPTVDSSSKY